MLTRQLALLVLGARLLVGDGGTLVLRKQAGPLIISVFSSPQPLRVGSADLSVMVQRTAGQTAVLDADVRLHLTQRTRDGISELVAPAKHENAGNKLLYAAQVNLPASGPWRLSATVDAPKERAEIAGEVTVLGAQSRLLAHWPYFAIVPAVMVLFAFNQLLKRRRRATGRRARA